MCLISEYPDFVNADRDNVAIVNGLGTRYANCGASAENRPIRDAVVQQQIAGQIFSRALPVSRISLP
jgi:hypothetical protein